MPDLDNRLRAEFQRLATRYAGEREPAGPVLAAVRRRRHRTTAGATATAAAAAVAAAVLGATVLVGGARPAPVPGPPAASGLPADQFVGLLLPAHPGTQTQYAWTFSLRTGKPVRRLIPALNVIGVSGDRHWALVEQDPTGAACGIGFPSVLASLTGGGVVQPWPAGYLVMAAGIGGGTAVAVAAARPAAGGSCPGLVLLSYDLASRQLRTYPLAAADTYLLAAADLGVRSRLLVAAVSPDGHSAVLDNADRPGHQTFLLARIDPDRGTASVSPLPPAPTGCTTTGYGFRPPAGVLTVNMPCGRTMRITGYDPATLRQVDQVSIPDPPGAAVTFFGAAWDRTGTQALIEAIHDASGPHDDGQGFRKILIVRNGRISSQLVTQAYGVTW